MDFEDLKSKNGHSPMYSCTFGGKIQNLSRSFHGYQITEELDRFIFYFYKYLLCTISNETKSQTVGDLFLFEIKSLTSKNNSMFMRSNQQIFADYWLLVSFIYENPKVIEI